MGNSFQKEIRLAKQLQELCDDDGRELNPIESAVVLNEFGLLYREKGSTMRTICQIYFIQSSAFLNAAIVRQPKTNKFKIDLQDLCSHVLEVAKAEKLQADLCAISNQALERVKKLRKVSNESLDLLENIRVDLNKEELRRLQANQIYRIRELQYKISTQYVSLMDYVISQSIEIMGCPPCRYSITAMGSLARREVTPFSDFEHIILLEEGVQNAENYEDILDYFRWVSTISHIIVINLKETIIRSVAIPWLNDDTIKGGDWFFDIHTTCGIKFDGMQLHACKIPLGRKHKSENNQSSVELIRPVSEMVKYLEIEEDIKNGYHLADVLTKILFVSGSDEVHDSFSTLVKQTLRDNKEPRNRLIIEDIKAYFKDFDILNCNIVQNPLSNIKHLLYRTSTLFVSALGVLCSIDKYSCFEIIDELFEKNLICKKTKYKFLYMISIACAARLKYYRLKNEQHDFFDNWDLSFGSVGFENTRLSDVFGEQIFGDYLLIVFVLQQALKRREFFPITWKQLKIKKHVKFTILGSCLLYNRVLIEWEKYRRGNIEEGANDDNHIRRIVANCYERTNNYEAAYRLWQDLNEKHDLGLEIRIIAICGKCTSLIGLKSYGNAITYIAEAKKTVVTFNITCAEGCRTLGKLSKWQADCQKNLGLWDEAKTSYIIALEYFSLSNLSVNRTRLENISEFYLSMAECDKQLQRHDLAILCASVATIITLNDAKSECAHDCFGCLGDCYYRIDNFKTAKKYFEAAIDIFPQNILHVDEENYPAIVFYKNMILNIDRRMLESF